MFIRDIKFYRVESIMNVDKMNHDEFIKKDSKAKEQRQLSKDDSSVINSEGKTFSEVLNEHLTKKK